MNFIDTHAHIYSGKLFEDKEALYTRIKEANISKVLMPNIDKESLPNMLSLYESYPQTYLPMLGLHPVDVKEDYEEEIEEIFSTFDEKYVAVGEIGLDLYWDKSTLEIQKKAFQKQIDFALEKNLPISVHVRDAFPQALDILELYEGKGLSGVLHCFTGTLEEAHRVLNIGLSLGVGGVLTFKNAGVDKVIAEIPMQYLVLETDSPYLAPTPYRGKTNEPTYLPLIAQKLADIKNISIEQVAEQTTINAQKLFKL